MRLDMVELVVVVQVRGQAGSGQGEESAGED